MYVVPRGDLDVSSSDTWRSQLLTAVDDPGTTRVVVDLAQVRFVDSTGLGVLIGTQERARERDVVLVLRRPPAQLERLMAMTQTYSIFRWDG